MWAEQIDVLFDNYETTIARDLKMNLKSLVEGSTLSPTEYSLIVLAIASAKNSTPLAEASLTELKAARVPDDVIQEAIEAGGIMGQLNTYYKFKKFLKNSNPQAEADYGPAKLRMQSLASPKMGKEQFELIAIAVSLVNACEQCVVAHEESARKLGATPEKIHDVVRLTASLFGTVHLLHAARI